MTSSLDHCQLAERGIGLSVSLRAFLLGVSSLGEFFGRFFPDTTRVTKKCNVKITQINCIFKYILPHRKNILQQHVTRLLSCHTNLTLVYKTLAALDSCFRFRLIKYSFLRLTSGFYTAKNYELLKTGLNNVVLPILFNVVNNIVQHCYT